MWTTSTRGSFPNTPPGKRCLQLLRTFSTHTTAVKLKNIWGLGCSSDGRASDRHAADAGPISRCCKGFFCWSQLSVQTLLRCPYIPVRNCMHLHLCACLRSRSSCQNSVDYGNTETSSMHPRLGSATLSQLAFPGKGN